MNNTTRKFKPKSYIQFFLGIISLVLIAITYSCEEDPSELGSNLLPDSDKINIRCDSSITFNCFVNNINPFATSDRVYYTLGEYQDDYFGMVNGSYAGQFLPVAFNEKVDDISIDSVVLYIQVDSVFGNPEGNIKFNVYELNSGIVEEDTIYSDFDINSLYSTTDLISTDCNISDSLVVLPLSNEFANKFISNKDTIYNNDSLFKTIFKGIYITPELLNTPGGLLTTNISSSNTKIVLYYKTADKDSLSASFSLLKGHRFGKYNYNYTSSLAYNFLTNPPSENDSLIFIQGLNGINSKITFSNYKSWLEDDSAYSILDAELIIPVLKLEQYDNFPPPQQLFFYYCNDDSTKYQLEDYASGNSMGGIYDKTKNQYSFNISKHFRDFINGNIADSCLNFSIANNGYYPNRVILKSGDNIKFRVTYTKH